MSLTHYWLGASVLKFCASRFGAAGRWCFELVVALYFLATLARKFCRCILAATVLRSPTCVPDRADQEPGEVNLPAFSGQQRLQQPAYQEPCALAAALFTMASSSFCSANWHLRRAFSIRSRSSTALLSCEKRALLRQFYNWLSWSLNFLAAAATSSFFARARDSVLHCCEYLCLLLPDFVFVVIERLR